MMTETVTGSKADRILAWVRRSSWMNRRRRPGQASIGRASTWWITWVLGRSADGRASGADSPRESVAPGLAQRGLARLRALARRGRRRRRVAVDRGALAVEHLAPEPGQ